MSKMCFHDSFGHLKHKLWPKEGPKVKLSIWLWTTKSWESPWFPYVQVACHIPLEDLDKGYNFVLDLISIKGLHTELCTPKVVEVLIVGISETKWHVGAGLVAKPKEY